MLNFLKRLFIKDKNKSKDHRGRDLQTGEKSVSARLKETAKSQHSGVRRAPIDMAQGD